MKQLDELLARVPELQAKAREREKARQAKAEKDSTAVVPAVVQLPLWPDAVRRLPNELLRSALFNARNRKQPRAYLKKTDIAVLFEGRITYQGEELRQDDETVWLQLIH